METVNMQFYVKSHKKSDGIMRFCHISKFDPSWGTQGVTRVISGGNFDKNRKKSLFNLMLLIVINLNRCQNINNRIQTQDKYHDQPFQ